MPGGGGARRLRAGHGRGEGKLGSTAFTSTIHRAGDPSFAISVSLAVRASGANAPKTLDLAGFFPPSGSSLRGQGSVHRLTGGAGNDLLVLGNGMGHFDDDGTAGLGSTDRAVSTAFNHGDHIQRKGTPSDDHLISIDHLINDDRRIGGDRRINGSHGGVPGGRIDVLSPSAEAIGFWQTASLSSLNLDNASPFVCV